MAGIMSCPFLSPLDQAWHSVGPRTPLYKSMLLRGKPATLSTRPPGHQVVAPLWQSFLNWALLPQTLWVSVVPLCSEAGGFEVQDLSKRPETPDRRSPRPAPRITPQPTKQEWLNLLHRPWWERPSEKMCMLSPPTSLLCSG